MTPKAVTPKAVTPKALTPSDLVGTREGRLELLCLGLVAAVLLVPTVGLMRYQGPPMEEGFMLVFPEQLLQGRLPHRDFLHLYGPGSIWLLAGVYEVFGTHITVERTVGLLQHAAVAYGLYALLRPFGRPVATAASITSVLILIGPLGLSAMAWNAALACGICSLAVGAAATVAQGRRATLLSALCGVLAGAALLFRPDLVVAVGLGTLALFLRLPAGRRAPLVIGGAATVALYVPHLLLSGVGNAIEGMFLEPVFELRGGRSLPVPPSWGEVDGFLQRAGGLRVSGWPFPMPDLSHQIHLWFWLVPLSILVVLAGGWSLRRAERRAIADAPAAPAGSDDLTTPTSLLTRRTAALWPASLFGAALITQAVQRPDTAHLAWVTGVTFPLAIASIATLVELHRPRWHPATRAGLGIGIIAVLLLVVIPFYPLRTYADLVGQSFGHNRFGFAIERDGRTFYFGSEDGADAAQQVTDRLDELAEPGDRLVVGPRDLSRANYSDAFFYHLFPDLVPGTRYIEMDPGIADAEDSGLAEELERNDWLILSDAWSGWTEPNDSAEGRSQAPNRVVEERYCMVLDADVFQLLERCR